MHLIVYALSRAPVLDAPEAEVFINSALAGQLTSDPYLRPICDTAANDLHYLAIVEAIMQNKNVNDLPPTHPARQYKAFWNDLSVLDVVLLVLNDSRIVVPKSFRPLFLKKLHHSHSGIVKTKHLARNLYYWPGMSGEI